MKKNKVTGSIILPGMIIYFLFIEKWSGWEIIATGNSRHDGGIKVAIWIALLFTIETIIKKYFKIKK